MTDFDTVDYFTDQSLVPDPHPYFDHLRSKCPVVKEPHYGVLAVTGFEEATTILKETDTFSSCIAVAGPFPPLPFTPEGDDITEQIAAHRPLDKSPVDAIFFCNDDLAQGALLAALRMGVRVDREGLLMRDSIGFVAQRSVNLRCPAVERALDASDADVVRFHHLATTTCMDIHHPYIQTSSSTNSASHCIRNVVEFQIKEDIKTKSFYIFHNLWSTSNKEFFANF